MTVKEITKQTLSRLEVGAQITTEHLKEHVQFIAGIEGQIVDPHRDTMLRYLREMETDGQRCFKCIDNHKSIYRRVR